jgi:hypothetical protein
LTIGVAIFAHNSIQAVRFPYPLDYGEGPLLNQARWLATGRNIYPSDLTDYPYTIANYLPGYVTVLALAGRLFGLSYATGRGITLIAALLSAGFIASILYTLTRDKLASVIGGLLFFAFPSVIYWSTLVRVDFLALAFSLAGIFVIVRWFRERWSPFVSALLMLGAVFTRQTYLLAGPLAVAGVLCFHNPRRAAGFVVTLLTGGILLFASLYTLTDGGIFFHTVIANMNRLSLPQFAHFFLHLLLSVPLLLSIGIVEGTSTIRRVRGAALLPPLYLIGGFLSALTVGKVGSSANYLLELLAALALITGIAAARWRRSSRPSWARVILFGLLTLQVAWLLRFAHVQATRTALRIQMQPELRLLERLVEEAPGPMLADEYTGLLVMSGHPLLLQPFEFAQLARGGKWDQTRVVADIQAGRFTHLLISDQPPVFNSALARSRWTPEMWAAIQEAYEPVRVLAGTTVYRPRG